MIQAKKNLTFPETVCLCLLICKVVSILLFNFTRLRYVIDYDSSVFLTQAIEIWEQKTIFIQDWAYQTSLGWESSILIAALLYGLTKNIYLAYGLSNCIVTVMVCYYLLRIGRDLELKKAHLYFATALVFTVFTHHQLGYIDVCFTNSAAYGLRIMTCVVFMSEILRLIKGKTFRDEWFGLALSFLLIFIAGCSSGSYMLLCLLMPLMTFTMWRMWVKSGKIIEIVKDRAFLYLVVACIVQTSGILMIHYVYPVMNSVAGSKTLCSAEDVVGNICAAFVGIFELLGGIASGSNYPVFSKAGILSLLGMVTVICLMISIISSFREILHETSDRLQSEYRLMVFFLMGFNAGALCLLNLTYGAATFESRYWIIVLIPAFLLIAIYLDRLSQDFKVYQVFFCICFTASCVCSVFNLVDYFRADDGYDDMNQLIQQINEEYGMNTIFIDNIIQGRIIRPMIPECEVVPLTEDMKIYGWGAKMPREFGDKIGLLVQTSAITDQISQNKRIHYLKSFKYGDYKLYTCEEGVFDFYSGPSVSAVYEMDYPTSPGYCFDESIGQLNENGELWSIGVAGCLLWGPYVPSIEGTYDITIFYDMIEDNGAVFDIAIDTIQLAETPIIRDQNSVTIKNTKLDDGHILECRVWVNEGTKIGINKILFEKI